MKRSIISICIVSLLFMPLLAFGKKDLDEIRILFEKREFSSALSSVDKFLSDNPKQPEALFLRGLILFESGDIEESIEVFKVLTQEYPTKPELYNNLAVAYAVQGDYFKARDALQRAIEIYPGYTKAHENLGDIYMNIARNAYEKALQLDPEKKSLQSKLDHINNLPIMQGQPKKKYDTKKENLKPLKPEKDSQTKSDQPITKIEGNNIATLEAKKIAKAVVSAEVQKMAKKSGNENEKKVMSISENKDPCLNWAKDKKLKIQEEENIIKTLESWAKKWSEMDVAAYVLFYGDEFKPPNGLTRKAWELQRKERLNKSFINVTIKKPKIIFDKCDLAKVFFNQKYESGGYKDFTRKMIIVKKSGTDWKIIKEGKASK